MGYSYKHCPRQKSIASDVSTRLESVSSDDSDANWALRFRTTTGSTIASASGLRSLGTHLYEDNAPYRMPSIQNDSLEHVIIEELAVGPVVEAKCCGVPQCSIL